MPAALPRQVVRAARGARRWVTVALLLMPVHARAEMRADAARSSNTTSPPPRRDARASEHTQHYKAASRPKA